MLSIIINIMLCYVNYIMSQIETKLRQALSSFIFILFLPFLLIDKYFKPTKYQQ